MSLDSMKSRTKNNAKKVIALAVSSALLMGVSGCNDSQPEAEKKVVERPHTSDAQPLEQSMDLSTDKVIQEEAATDSAKSLYAKSTQTLFHARALQASLFGVDTEVAGGYYADRLEDYSPQAEAKMREQLREYSEQLLMTQEDTAQGEENRAVMANLARYYAGEPSVAAGYIDVWMGHSPFIVSQINGPAIDVPNFLQNNHPIKSLKDAQDYVTRLSLFGEFIDSVESKVLFDAESNWIPPQVTINGAIGFLDGFTSAEPAEHALVVNLVDKLSTLEIDDAQKEQLISDATMHMTKTVYPAYRQLNATMSGLLDKATTESGIWAQPNGDVFYRDAVKQLGDTDLTPDEIHKIGLMEVDRIVITMDAILKSEGYTEGAVGARMTALNDEERFIYEDSDAGRQLLLDDLNGMLADINKVMASQFASVPPYDVEIRRIPVERQDGAPGGQYTAPTLDGSAPGIYWINLRDMKANASFDLKTLTYHEANPGHHWQIALNMAQEELPLLRRIAPYNAYIEGWALYSEQVAWEMGMYKDDPFGDLGRLKAELFRAVRLVVDTGLHSQKWSREKAIKYMAETTGTAQSDVVSEIERYMAWPGQALGYKLGMLNILSQREKAKKALGDKFDIKAFHDLVLLGGAVPMSVLNTKVENWIASQQD